MVITLRQALSVSETKHQHMEKELEDTRKTITSNKIQFTTVNHQLLELQAIHEQCGPRIKQLETSLHVAQQR